MYTEFYHLRLAA